LCRETLTHITKTAEAQTGAPTATVTRELAKEINKYAAPGDRVSGEALKHRVREHSGEKKRKTRELKKLLNTGHTYGVNGYIFFAGNTNDATVFKIGQTERNPHGRVQSLNGYGVNEWVLIESIELPGLANTRRVEKKIHDKFDAFKVHGELFKMECIKDALAFTRELASDLYDFVIMSLGHNKPHSETTHTPGGFNRTNDATIGWAQYTWNPVTGCKHSCDFCYARKIANRRMGIYKNIGFEPHFHNNRLTAPAAKPQSPPDRNGGNCPNCVISSVDTPLTSSL
jgi:hypothetical protein